MSPLNGPVARWSDRLGAIALVATSLWMWNVIPTSAFVTTLVGTGVALGVLIQVCL